MSGKTYPAAVAGVTFASTGAGAMLNEAGTASGSMRSNLTGLVDWHMTTSESAEMSYFLRELLSMMGN